MAGLAPVFEFVARQAEVSGRTGPTQTAFTAGVSLADATGRHSLRFQAASREVNPDKSSLSVCHDQLQSTKTSVEYGFCSETRAGEEVGSSGQIKHVSAELAGLFGDVSLARVCGLWSFTKRIFGAGVCNFSATGGLATALENGQGTTSLPLEDRFFRGGASGGPGERLHGFAARGVGPDYRGGQARLSVSTFMRWPIPLCGPLQLTTFGSVGTLSGIGRASRGIFDNLAEQVRASVGAGVGVPLSNGGFVGLTYSQPLFTKAGDKLEPFQVSFSFSSPM
jgi:outer membrane protein assembly factor BamA